MRKAFTRRAFQIEHGLDSCSEQLEFFGDTVLNTVVTREIYKRFTEISTSTVDAPFESKYSDGDLSKMRTHFVSKEYLSERAKELELDRFILYGSDENATDSSREDMMEALIGAVAVDFPNRTSARERAAMMAVGFIQQNGLWVDLKNANLEPRFEDAINQLQELKQKKYDDEPEYTFEEWDGGWKCSCTCGGVVGYGKASSKTKAKKKAAFMVLVRLLKSAGLCSEELEHTMWQMHRSDK